MSPEAFLSERIRLAPAPKETLMIGHGSLDSQVCLADQVRDLPADKVPVILLGGSFNTDRRPTRMQPWAGSLLEHLVREADPDRCFFVVGHKMLAYEQDLIRMAGGRFSIYAIVPTRLTRAEAARLKKSGVGIRISIEPVGMGLYKSFAYEIFKRRPSVVVALDGNSAGANVIQEARNGKRKARIFVNRHASALSAKARTLQGYARLFDSPEASEDILKAIGDVYEEMAENPWERPE